MVAVEAVVLQLLIKLADPLIKEVISLYEVDDKVELIVTQFTQMQCFLKDADAKQEGDERVKNWVLDVTDAAYVAEDLIDTFILKVEPLKRTGFVGRITRYAFIFSELIARYKLRSEFERINNKIRVISESRSTFGIQNTGQEAGTISAGPSLQEWRLTSPLDQEPDFIGFEKDLEILVDRLTKGELRRCVVSVVGMGGLGKTTLTKKVYNDTRVKARFHDFCAWICLSQEYDVKDVLKKIIDRYMVLSEEESKKVEKMDVFELRHKISEYLKGKRYLVVVDDIWTSRAWDDIKGAFPLNDTLPAVENGSRVMITTRIKVVALHADAQSLPYELLTLGKDESWNLFCRKAFPGHGNICPDKLKQLGEKIVEKCCGLPLVIVVIGGLLSTKKEEWEWQNVSESITWQINQGQEEISEILSLSFRDLPYHLKPCFLYLGIFPEDYEFRAKKLIQLWAAEGFLQQRGNQTVEKVGEDFLNELIQRSIIQLAKRSSNGGIKSCRIHDLLRDLSISKAKEGMFLQVHHGNSNAPASRARRLVIHSNALSECTSLNSSSSRCRSVLIYHQGNDMLESTQEKLLYEGYNLLRVLDLHNVDIKELSSEIGALIHLKYLRCTRTCLKRLPSSIGNLHNLQTLVVTSMFEVNIPSEIEKMEQLRHFQVMYPIQSRYYRGRGVIQGRPRLNQMSNLHTLTWVKVGEWMHGCLESLTHLRKLGICLDYGMFDVYGAVLFESILKLKCLQSLLVTTDLGYLEFPNSSVRPLSSLPSLRKLVLEGELANLPEPSEFLTNVTKLTLKRSNLKQDPLATLEKLENLRILRLLYHSYSGVTMACTSKGFPRLESLHLEELGNLYSWTVEEGALPTLTHLQINSCHRLRMLPEGLQHVTTLKKLELLNMPYAFNRRLRKDEGEDWNIICHIPSIDIIERN
ncbi:probable disease resistance protein RF45 [Magnolia sinica]|uniref:probable disease resistance protein RF45 n=1 Tax=Magnolia sinica TaxID=86752 RepID=UPI00265808FE|nr:probable disease resistance protein RF45 [Magnolia sinica]XP_058114605.1 probable disease resistance protein RF45 [Magnolia sinica]XP_058114606.1 probable disease resistance protein RF45 [Magnolia sinica]XP_058114607.1 probable disease resistance protein RF45 [Magnolia sinica]XP_058114608.1 probable disease resistance protein RF45 [Magnolia sinica]XP_058114609.1 probable disease resistance protein RF45 [Magnolia sinica]XP_058114611.1 probable disease resistance protein RF45 [Magnolia sinic